MKKILVIGSTVVDVIININYLPGTAGDIHVKSQQFSLGGCAFNVADTINNFEAEHILFSPIGTGIYGDFVREEFRKINRKSPIETPDMDNGCCYCFVEDSGERTFVSYHGAEYLIYEKWLKEINMQEILSVYICGLEIEDKTGEEITRFLEGHKEKEIFFAPGPRITSINEELLDRLFCLNPILHLNEAELFDYTKETDLKTALIALYNRTNNTIITTLSDKGACYFNGQDIITIKGHKQEQIDTIGAGDAHIGAIMACLAKGDDLDEAINKANTVAAKVVTVNGALLEKEVFDSLF